MTKTKTKRRRKRKAEKLIAQALVQNGFVMQEDIDKAYEALDKTQRGGGLLAYFVRHRKIDEKQAAEVLVDCNLSVLACPECEKVYLVHNYDPTKIVKCKKCNIALIGGVKIGGDEFVTEEVLEEDPLLGQSIAHYRIVGLLGEGGMGTVYKAYDELLKRNVAVKVLVRNSPRRKRTDFERFRQEARSAAGLHHPNIVTIFDVGETDDYNYLAMEYLDGRNLHELLSSKKKFSVREATTIVRQVAIGLQAAHEQGIIHRDIKPGNIVLLRDGKVKVTDFGLAKVVHEDASVTREGALIGTPSYMSPEQCSGIEVDARSDIYSLGLTFFQLLTGRLPYTGNSASIIRNHASLEPCPSPSVFNPKLPVSACVVINKMLAKKPEERYQGMRELVADLDSLIAEDQEGEVFRNLSAESVIDAEMESESSVLSAISRPLLSPAPQRPATPLRAHWLLFSVFGLVITLVNVSLAYLITSGRSREVSLAVEAGRGLPMPGTAAARGEPLGAGAAGSWQRDEAAKKKLEEANSFAAANPDKLEEIATRFEAVGVEFANSLYGQLATERAVKYRLELHSKKISEQLAELRSSAQKQKTSQDKTKTLDVMVSLAEAFWRRKNYNMAQGLYSEALKMDPGNADIAEKLNRVKFEQNLEAANKLMVDGKFDAAKAMAQRAREARVDDNRVAMLIERIQLAKKNAGAGKEIHVPVPAVPVTVSPAKLELPGGLEPITTETYKDTNLPMSVRRVKDGAVMVLIPEGTFEMGTNRGFKNASGESPAHKVMLTAYYIGKYEVTWGRFQKYLNAKSIEFAIPDDDMNKPVHSVTYDEALAYAKWVGGRLPTEAEWEHAARGRTNTLNPWGDAMPDSTMANFERVFEGETGNFSEPVGSFPEDVSTFGVYDMAGNVSEWCLDWYNRKYYVERVNYNPRGPLTGILRSVRGGSWRTKKAFMRATYRGRLDPKGRYSHVGFRCVIPVRSR